MALHWLSGLVCIFCRSGNRGSTGLLSDIPTLPSDFFSSSAGQPRTALSACLQEGSRRRDSARLDCQAVLGPESNQALERDVPAKGLVEGHRKEALKEVLTSNLNEDPGEKIKASIMC